jgi:phosphatidylglycerophosphate synthase
MAIARTISAWDRKAAGLLARPLARLRARPNVVTLALALLGLGSGLFFAGGQAPVGGFLFLAALVFGHVDGALAKLTGQTSGLGHGLHRAACALAQVSAFTGIGFGLAPELGPAAPWLGFMAGAGIASATGLRSLTESRIGAGSARGGFEVADALYFVAPLVWLGLGSVLIIVAALAATVCLTWTIRGYAATRRRKPREQDSRPLAPIA